MIGNSHNLADNLKNYEQYIGTKPDDSKGKYKKQWYANKTQQIMALGVGNFSKTQEDSIIEFNRLYTKTNREDHVVNFSSFLVNLILHDREFRNAPEDIKIVISAFLNPSNLNSLTENQRQRVFSYAANRILEEGENLSYADLTQFTQIITVGWKSLSSRHAALTTKFRQLIDGVSQSDEPDANKFVEYAIALIEKARINLVDNLQNYAQYIGIEEDSTEFQQKKQELAESAKTIMSLGIGKFTINQGNCIIDFSRSHVKSNPEDSVVQLSSVLAELILIDRLPADVKISIRSFMDISRLSSLTENQRQQVFSYAANRILEDGENLSYADLTQLTKIITVGWKSLSHRHDALATKFRQLIVDVTQSDPKEFVEYAIALIKEADVKSVPLEIQNCPEYHGKALEFAFSKFQEMLLEEDKPKHSFSDFVNNYCKSTLKEGQYLIRNSSTVPSRNAEGIKYFPITISYKISGMMKHIRLTREENKEGKISWKESNGKSYESIKHFLSLFTAKGYRPYNAPSEKELTDYVRSL